MSIEISEKNKTKKKQEKFKKKQQCLYFCYFLFFQSRLMISQMHFFFQASRYVRLNVKGCPALRDVTLNICVLVVHIYVLNLLRALLSQLSSASCLV